MTQRLPKITISGGPHSGKTTLAILIAQTLKTVGINAIIRNDDTDPLQLERLVETNESRLAGLAKDLQGETVVIDQSYREVPNAHLVVSDQREFVQIDFLQTPRKED